MTCRPLARRRIKRSELGGGTYGSRKSLGAEYGRASFFN